MFAHAGKCADGNYMEGRHLRPDTSGYWRPQPVRRIVGGSRSAFHSSPKAMHRTAPLRFRIRSSCARWVRAALIFGTVICVSACPDNPPAVQAPKPTSIAIIPPVVAVAPNATFTMRVRVRDQSSMILPDAFAATVQWTWTPLAGLTEVPVGATTGASITFKATASTTPNPPPPVNLKATLSSVSGPATASVTVGGNSPSAGTMDWIIAPHNNSGPPMAALVDGQTTTWHDDDVFAFVGSSALDRFMKGCDTVSGSCGQLTVFPGDWSVVHQTMTWTNGCDVADFAVGANTAQMQGPDQRAATWCIPSSGTTLGPPVPIPATILIVAKGNVAGSLTADITRAKNLLARAPTGLTFNPTLVPPTSTTFKTKIVVHLDANDKCVMDSTAASVRQQLLWAGVSAGAFKPNAVLFVYVDEVQDAAAGAGLLAGFTCPADIASGTVVLIGINGRLATTFAHELGHALGPWPLWGHPEDFGVGSEFDGSNLMVGGENDWSAANRQHLTLGQVFRITVARDALVNGSGSGIQCYPDMTKETPCPRLAKDIGQ